LRILILYAGFLSRSSGTDERVFQIATGLANQGVKVKLSACVDPSNKPNVDHTNFIEFPDSTNVLKILAWVVQIVACSLKQKYDIVQMECFSPIKTLALFLLMRPFTRKFVIVLHDKRFKNDPRQSLAGKFRRSLQRVVLKLFDHSITPGIGLKKWFEELHGNSIQEKMTVIPNGVTSIDMNNVDCSELRHKHGLGGAFVALFFGSMVYRPNYETAMNLYKTSDFVSEEFKKRTNNRFVFAVAGIGSENLPKTEHFVPLGFVKKFEELLSFPDVIVLPHLPSYSGPHIKTNYAFLSRKPVIATNDAVKDMPFVFPNKHYIPFNIDEKTSLVDAIISVYQNKELQKSLATNALEYTKKFSWDNISRMHVDLYEHLLSQQ
jgi:glycosyltransferase involved in cell wall biosynthesis